MGSWLLAAHEKDAWLLAEAIPTRRPYVYERSAPQGRRDVEQEGGADYVPAAVPALLREAEAAGAITLARYLGHSPVGTTAWAIRSTPFA